MKYKSEIIKEIVDNRGHKKSSLHYESECVESWIKETKGSYPKLTDYESEWLNYMEENRIGMFPYMTLSDVTIATVENVVPYAYKSAILTGQTLVNLAKVRSATTNNVCSEKNIVIKPNTKYIAMFNPTYDEGTGRVNYALLLVSSVSLSNSVASGDDAYTQSVSGGKGSEYAVQKGDRYLIFTSKDNESYIHIRTGGEIGVTYTDMIILEYQDGMENWDIPYFEGMQSVQMPVLTTTGKNLCPNIFIESNKGRIHEGNGGIHKDFSLKPSVYVSNYINVKGLDYITYNRQLGLNQNGTNSVQSYAFYDENKKYITGMYDSTTLTVPSNAHYFRITIDSEQEFQLEKGSQSTPYEPYKSNILTVNEPVELRGIGDVKDELNVATGELTQRVKEVVLNGSEDWMLSADFSSLTNTIHFQIQSDTVGIKFESPLISDKFVNHALWSRDIEGINCASNGNLTISINRDKLSGLEVADFKKWLSQNNVVVIGKTTESIKTVDLTVTDQDGNTESIIRPIEGTMHLSTSADNIKPTFSGEIPVEAITQNLASFIEE